jgi:hypothetical protein
MRALLLSTMIALGASCTVTAYPSPTGGSQQGQQTGSGGGNTQSPSPSPSPAPSPAPAPQSPSPPPDMARPPSPTPTPDMATTSSADCMKLSACCAQLPDPNDQQQCMDAVNTLDDQLCTSILQQLQDNGYCQ